MNTDSSSDLPRTPIFATTRWSVIMRAGDEHSLEQAEALSELCRAYWYPLYAFIRRRGADPHEAQDLVQEFFARLLERNYLHDADPAKGKFRWFLLGAVKHFLSNQRQRDRAAKRGGGQTHIPIDEILAEKWYQLEPATQVTPEKLYERSWALTLLERVRHQLRQHYEQNGKLERFLHLESFLPGDRATRSYAEVAQDLGLSEGALRVELHRLKAVFRRLLRAEIAHTVSTPAEIDDELKYLIQVLGE